jgi:pilus assembly protein CpaB
MANHIMKNNPHFGSTTRVRRKVYLPVLFGLFTLVLGLSAALLVRQGRARADADIVSRVPVTVVMNQPLSRIEVLVPALEVTAGSSLRPEMFRTKSILEGQAILGAIRNFREIEGFYAKTLLIPDQPLNREYLTPIKPLSDVISAIPEGFRAVTIRVDERTGVEGWARAGARVDIVWSSSINGKPTISVIVENAKILSAERQVGAAPENADGQPAPIPTTVTLLVQAEDANRIQLAGVSGTMSLSLRGATDNKANKTVPLTIDDLLAQGRPVDPNEQPRVMLSVKGSTGEKVGYTFTDGALVAVR